MWHMGEIKVCDVKKSRNKKLGKKDREDVKKKEKSLNKFNVENVLLSLQSTHLYKTAQIPE